MYTLRFPLTAAYGLPFVSKNIITALVSYGQVCSTKRYAYGHDHDHDLTGSLSRLGDKGYIINVWHTHF